MSSRAPLTLTERFARYLVKEKSRAVKKHRPVRIVLFRHGESEANVDSTVCMHRTCVRGVTKTAHVVPQLLWGPAGSAWPSFSPCAKLQHPSPVLTPCPHGLTP